MKNKIEIFMAWDSWNAALLISKLFRHVKKEEISFSISTKKNTDKISIKIDVLPKASPDEFLEEVVKYIKKRIYSLARQGEKLDVPDILFNDKMVEYRVEYNKTLVRKDMKGQVKLV